jgi:hypothetical protein
MDFMLAQVATPRYNFFELPAGSGPLWIRIVVAFALGLSMLFLFLNAPVNMRRYIVGAFTFMSGLFYVLLWLWPKTINFKPGQFARNPVEQFAIGLQETVPRISDLSQILTGFLLLLGIISLLRIHITRATRKAPDSAYSMLLLGSMAVMTVFGFWNWTDRIADKQSRLSDVANWTFVQYGQDFLFDGLLQQMEAAMFSIIAFYILSAAFRAFRIRSVESSVLMGSALILMLSLMGALTQWWGHGVDGLVASTHQGFFDNLKLEVVADWLKKYMQTPSIRAIEFGVGLGTISMGLRIWLGLEKGGGGA